MWYLHELYTRPIWSAGVEQIVCMYCVCVAFCMLLENSHLLPEECCFCFYGRLVTSAFLCNMCIYYGYIPTHAIAYCLNTYKEFISEYTCNYGLECEFFL